MLQVNIPLSMHAKQRTHTHTKIKFYSHLPLLNSSFRGKLLRDVNRARDRREMIRRLSERMGK